MAVDLPAALGQGIPFAIIKSIVFVGLALIAWRLITWAFRSIKRAVMGSTPRR